MTPILTFYETIKLGGAKKVISKDMDEAITMGLDSACKKVGKEYCL